MTSPEPFTSADLSGAVLAGTAVTGTAASGTVASGTAASGTAVTGTAVTGTAVTGTAVLAGTAASGTVVTGTAASGTVASVSCDDEHRFSKPAVSSIRLLAGIGVEGDSHAGATVQHLYAKKRNPLAPNLCQVHFLAAELFDELVPTGYVVAPGELGENVTTSGIDLMALPLGTRLHVGDEAVVSITGMRSPCAQINGYRKGLMKQLIRTDAVGTVHRRGGIMGVVVTGGIVNPGDGIRVELPVGEQIPLGVV